MIIISHRGYWKSVNEKNRTEAFVRSFDLQLGTETDVRDYNGELVISHDIPDASCLSFREMLHLYQKHAIQRPPLALNVKADGLQAQVKQTLSEEGIENYFLFDMSVPDMLGYFSAGLKTFVRVSEYESLNSLYDQADGVWLDGFKDDLVTEALLNKVINDRKRVCIVSPDLHKRPYKDVWLKYKSFDSAILSSDNLIICTDYPEECVEFFQ